MTGWIRSILVGVLLMVFAFSSASVLAQPLLPLENPGNRYPGFTINQNVTGAQGVVDTVLVVYKRALSILGPVLVLLLAWFAVQLIIAGGNEEKFTTVSRHFLYLLIGTAFVVFAKFLSETFFLYQGAGGQAVSFVSSEGQVVVAASRFQSQIEILIKFLRYVLTGLAVFFVVKSGSIILFSADDELVTKQKDVFMYGFVGFLLIIISSALVQVVFNLNVAPDFDFGSPFVSQSVNVGGGLSLLSNITNLFLAALSGLFLFMLVAGGVMYAFSGGNEEAGQKATKIITGAVLGLVIAFSSYTIVAEFSSGGGILEQANPAIAPLSPATPVTPSASPNIQ